jgi:hypothetical protein
MVTGTSTTYTSSIWLPVVAEGLRPLKGKRGREEDRNYWNKIIIDEHDPLDLWLIDGKNKRG